MPDETSDVLFDKDRVALVRNNIASYVYANRNGGVYLLMNSSKDEPQRQLRLFFFDAEFLANLSRAAGALPLLMRAASVSAIAFDFCSYDVLSTYIITVNDIRLKAFPDVSARLSLEDDDPFIEIHGSPELTTKIRTKRVPLWSLRRMLEMSVGADAPVYPPKGEIES